MKPATVDELLSINDIASISKQGRPTIYAAINLGHLRTMLIGRRRFAKASDVRAWIDRMQTASDKGHPIAYRARESHA